MQAAILILMGEELNRIAERKPGSIHEAQIRMPIASRLNSLISLYIIARSFELKLFTRYV
jgi:hypothetical protein